MQITKLKIKGDETEIHYTSDSDRTNSKTTVYKSFDKQSSEFLNALQEFKPYLLEVLDLDEKYGEGMTITGLTLKEENPAAKDFVNFGIVISAVKSLENSNAPLCLNTPYIPPRRNENVVTVMDAYLAKDIVGIIGFCERFIAGGERAQGELFSVKEVSK